MIDFIPGKLFKLKAGFQGNEFPVGTKDGDKIPSRYDNGFQRIVVGPEDTILFLRILRNHFNAYLCLVRDKIVVFYGDELEELR